MVRMPKTVTPVIAARTTHFRGWGGVDAMIRDVQMTRCSSIRGLGLCRTIIVSRSWRLSPRARGERGQKSRQIADPVVRIVGAAVLDVNELLAQAHGDGAGAAASDLKIAAHRAHRADRRDHGGGAAGKRFLQLAAGRVLAPLVERV